MSSRQATDTSSLSGKNYATNADRTDTMAQKNVFLSGGTTSNGSLTTLVGKTIRGLVVGPLEHWADGTVWDTTNNRPLTPGQDFDPTLLHRGF